MKTLKKTLFGIAAAVLAGTMVCSVAIAEETQQILTTPAAAEASAEETTQTLTTKDGVLSVEIAKGEAEWTVKEDPNYLLAASDGKNMITVSHLANGTELPKAATADDKYEEVYQMFYSTANEVFIITGYVADKDDAETVREAVCSFKVLQYDTLKKEEGKTQDLGDGYVLKELNETFYCTEEAGVNVRSGYSTDAPRIGSYNYGDEVKVTGEVTKEGAEFAWLRVDYNGQTGYTAAPNYSKTNPNANTEDELIAGGQIFTGKTIDYMVNFKTGESVLLKELNQGGWADETTGEIFHWETPQDGEPRVMYGDKGTTLWSITDYAEYKYAQNEQSYNNDTYDTGHSDAYYTGNSVQLFNEYGGLETLWELSDGALFNTENSEYFTKGSDGYWYGDQGTILYPDFNPGRNSEDNGWEQNEYGEFEDPDRIIVDYRQDGTPVYNDDPNIIDWRQDGTPVYGLPEGSEIVYDGDED